MATKSISQLDTQATANETDLFEVAIVDANSASGYASKKESAAAIADAIVGEYQYPLRITGTTAKTIAGAINELKSLVDLLPQFAIEVVQTLPVSDISETTIYLVPASDPEQGNYYEEYIYVNNAWELVGTTAVDLSGYYTSAQVDTLLAAKADSSSLATVATSGAYSDLTGKPTIDTALDTTSTNAVENRAVAGAINSIKSDITVEGSASGDIATFVDGSDNPLKELKISIVATQSGSGDPSPTNVRPISGFNAVNVGDISDTEKLQYFKGLLDGTYAFVDLGTLNWESGFVGFVSNSLVSDFITIENDEIYNMICPSYPTASYSSQTNPSITTVKYNNQSLLRIKDTNYNDPATLKSDLNGVYLIYERATPTTPTITLAQFNMLVSAFGLQGWLVQIAMPSEAGYVYGGLINVKTGELTSTFCNVKLSDFSYSKVTLTGKNVFCFPISSLPYAPITPRADITQNAISSMFKITHQGAAIWPIHTFVFTGAVSATLPAYYVGFIVPDTITNETEFKETYGNAQVIYELATPVTYQLTPTEVRSLLGLNNIWANCGAITELKYTRDLNLCINDIIARIEALEGGSNSRSLSISPVLTKSLTSDSDTAEGILEGKTEETKEETKEEAQNER